MKEYKKWVMGPVSDDWVRDEFTGAEAGWKAALEEVLKRVSDWDFALKDWINGELNDSPDDS